MRKHKPNLIPNNPKDGSFTREVFEKLINKNGGISDYLGLPKKDGVRLELGMAETPLSRSLEVPQSILVVERFKELNRVCLELKIFLEGEFYMHGAKFNEIFRFYSNTNVHREEYRKELEKKQKKNKEKFDKDFNNRDIDWLTNFHTDLKFWLFDGRVLDRPDLVGYDERMQEIENRLEKYENKRDLKFLVYPEFLVFDKFDHLYRAYDRLVERGWEGLVLVHKDHKYKEGRNSIKEGTILKMKDENNVWDGVVLDIVEGERTIEGAERVVDNFGVSSFSGKKEFKEPNGKAKGILVQFEDKGTFVVSLKGFTDPDKVELLQNKSNYIGRHFKYKGMPPVKDFPRSVYFECWRDKK